MMAERFERDALSGKRILIVEDEWLLADAIVEAVESAGGEVIGPFPSVRQSLAVLQEHAPAPDAATLNIRLTDGESYPVADQLAAMKVPFLFASANGASALPRRFSRAVLLRKPIAASQIIEALIVITSARHSRPSTIG
jgi:DNA-binding response OmpR family regulator